jgi:RHS repeat-associated protein
LYPFGLEHKGYNNVVNGVENDFKNYQGQELTKDLIYNMLEFKYRHYDPAIARFVTVDPLASKYAYNSTYAFQENKLGLGVELEGLELERLRGGVEQFFQGVKNLVSNETYGEAYRQMESSQSNNTEEKISIEQGGQQKSVAALGNMAEGGIEAVKGGSYAAGDALDNAGDALETGALVAAPFTEGASLGLLPIAEGLQATGKTIKGAVNISDGNYLDAGIEGSSILVNKAIGKATDKIIDASKRT